MRRNDSGVAVLYDPHGRRGWDERIAMSDVALNVAWPGGSILVVGKDPLAGRYLNLRQAPVRARYLALQRRGRQAAAGEQEG